MIEAKPFHWSFYAFIPVTVAMLFLDSKWVLAHGLNGQILDDILVPLYLYVIYRTMPDERLKKIMLLTIPVSAVGEVILSMGIELYTYKFAYVPIYVPFGHAIVIGSGFQLLWRAEVHDHASALIRRFLIFYAALFLGVFWVFGDSFTVLLGLLYFLGVFAMRQRVIYMFMPIFVLFVEFVGTAFGCWSWAPRPFEIMSTTNPPMGSVMFYVYLDMIVMALGSVWAAGWMKRGPVWLRPTNR
ncbi:MAG: hypothetical protein HY283_06030 [Nitrospirae bacterium]|nr:hypothetical protein [Nitrospirota bacterium]